LCGACGVSPRMAKLEVAICDFKRAGRGVRPARPRMTGPVIPTWQHLGQHAVLPLPRVDGKRGSDSFVVMSSYRHIVIFKFKADAPADQVRGVVEAFKALPSKLPAIKGFEWGTNVSPEGLDQGFTHVFTLTFASKEALEKNYLHEPAHQEFVAMLGGLLEKALVVDYNAA